MAQAFGNTQGFPQVSSPITTPSTGILTNQWYNFFANLWTRSGISQGGIFVPSGQIVPFAGPVDNIPQGWLWCNGTALGQDTFPSLFQAIGTSWGGVGNLTFNIPDFRNKVLVGAGPLYPFGSSGALGASSGGGSQLPAYAVINYMIKT